MQRHPAIPAGESCEIFPNALRGVPIILEKLGERDDVRNAIAMMSVEIDDSNVVRSETRQERRAGGSANGKSTVGPLEEHASLGQAVKVRRDDVLGTIAAQFRAKVIDGDEEDIWASRGCFWLDSLCQGGGG
jgi:hypothetical protein